MLWINDRWERVRSLGMMSPGKRVLDGRQSKVLSSVHPWFLLHLLTLGSWFYCYHWTKALNIQPNTPSTHWFDLVYSNLNEEAAIKCLCALQESCICAIYDFFWQQYEHMFVDPWWDIDELPNNLFHSNHLVDPNKVWGINYKIVGWLLGIWLTGKSILAWMTMQKVAFLKISTQIEGHSSKDSLSTIYKDRRSWKTSLTNVSNAINNT